MPLHGLTGHHRSQSGDAPEAPHQKPLASLVQVASQAFGGVGNPTATTQVSRQQQQQNQHQHQQLNQQQQLPPLVPPKQQPPLKQRAQNPANQNLRVQTETSAFFGGTSSGGTTTGDNSATTPIHSGGSSIVISPGTNSETLSPPRKSISFRLPSPGTQPSEIRQTHRQVQEEESYRSTREPHPPSAPQSHPGSQLPNRPSDPVQVQQLARPSNSYAAYHSSNPSSGTGSRPPLTSTATAPAGVPQAPSQQRPGMHRTNTGGNSGYSPNPSINTGGDVVGSRKYTHPGALTPTHPSSSSQYQSHQQSHLQNIGLSTLGSHSGSIREREDVLGSLGAVSPGKWMCPYGLYAIDWCKWNPTSGGSGRLAVGSYAEDSHNYIQVLDTRPGPPDASGAPTLEFVKLAEATHTYPITRVLWEPPSSKNLTDLIATSGDHLRLWSLPTRDSTAPSPNTSSITARNYAQPTQKLTPLALLSNSKSTDFTAPLTSLDWNQVSPSLIITSSIDTTCTIWDIPTLTAKTQLIAHDKEVFDVRFMSNSLDVFASCGADGSVRMFDLRSLEHSTIIYEPGGNKSSSSSASGDNREGGSPVNNAPPALLRLAASPHDQHLIATFCTDSPVVRILDVRQPGQALVELKGHTANVNCCEWNPGRRGVLAAGGDDCEVLLWDIFAGSGSGAITGNIKTEKGVEQERNPMAWWSCDVEVNNLSWSPSVGKNGSDWIGVVGGRGVYGLGV
ncbi:WD40-repeat-containing domain protein [Pyronema domesticum]|uniref:Similar to Uncharacterized WD repeat-containing protein C17D11.08 acc. no. O74763 n=1 Tax=Pyronema omphalodes (strain CBS 100304) TaxID=1076935 RepID=U4LLS0_PYROM|nr:WD40-repeat-containing domain protein [Pyronema domesticum]CCX30280.1 Similar to Uncharacterized WD repeat-containing protein C17D11.08; acc. no. O74763 [Pyronema omphalodes CBS 100304]